MFWKKKDEELEEAPQPEPVSQDWSGNAEADLERIKAKLEVLDAYRKTGGEHSARVSEELGELRAQILELQKSLERISIDSSKAIDLVNAVQPQNLMKEVQKEDAKLEALHSEVQVDEEMQKALKSQLQDIKRVTDAFKGAESLLKLEKEIRDELVSLQKLRATVERHAEKSEDIFVEFQKQYAQFLEFKDMTKDLQSNFESVLQDLDKVKVKQAQMVTNEKFETFTSTIREQITNALRIVNESKSELAQYAQKAQELRSLISQAKMEEKRLSQATPPAQNTTTNTTAIEREQKRLREEMARLVSKVNALEASPAPTSHKTQRIPEPPRFEEPSTSQQVQVEEEDLEMDLPPPPSPQEEEPVQTPQLQEIIPQEPNVAPQSASSIPLYSEAQISPFFKGQVIDVEVTVVGKDGSGIAREKGFTVLVDNAKKGTMRVKVQRIFNSIVYTVPTSDPVSAVEEEQPREEHVPSVRKGSLPALRDPSDLPTLGADELWDYTRILKE